MSFSLNQLAGVHSRFVHTMFPLFGLKEAPQLLPIKDSAPLRGYIGQDGSGDYYLAVNPRCSDADHTCAHESGHWLHVCARPNDSHRDSSPLKRRHSELIAEYAAIRFIHATEGNLDRYLWERDHDEAHTISTGAYDFFLNPACTLAELVHLGEGDMQRIDEQYGRLRATKVVSPTVPYLFTDGEFSVIEESSDSFVLDFIQRSVA